MPIQEIHEAALEHVCIVCGYTQTTPFDMLVVGVERGDEVNDRVMALQPCAGCGAGETLAASPENEPEHPAPGSFGHRHRLLVDLLHARLVREGRVLPALLQQDIYTHEPGSATLETWFSGRLRLERNRPQTEEGG